MITTEQFKSVFPAARQDITSFIFTPQGQKILEEGGINTPKRLANFLAQVGHESGGFKYNKELGGAAYFQKYEGRKNLGNIYPGDGYKYRGRGLIQLTGRYNYTKYSKILGLNLVDEPEIVINPEVSLRIAVAYWELNNLNELADVGNVKAITRRINGGLNGYQDRLDKLGKLYKVMGVR